MRIKVEFTDPATTEDHELIMEGPEIAHEELREIVLDALESYFGATLPNDLDLKISEVAHGTIH